MGSILFQIKQVLKNLQQDEITSKAAALSYSSLLSLVPLTVLVVSVFSLFPGFADLATGVKEFVYQNLVPTAGDMIEEYIGQFVERASTVRTVGLLVFLVTSLLLLSNIENTLNSIWHVKKGRAIVQRVTVYWAMLTLGPLFLGASLAMSSYVLANEWFNFIDNGWLKGLQLLPFLFEMCAFLMMYLLMPNRNVSFKYALIGAIVATFLFLLAQKVFIIWASNFQSYTFIYGALATIPIFLLWIYISWLVILTGAEIAALPHRIKDEESDKKVPKVDEKILDNQLV